jgi:prepilin-type processing-associated H-X9-DG protein
MVVIAIIAILASMLLPALGKARATARKITCLNNQKQIYTGLAFYIDDNDDILPTFSFWSGYIAKYLNLEGAYKYFDSIPSTVSYVTRKDASGLFICPSGSPSTSLIWSGASITADCYYRTNYSQTVRDWDIPADSRTWGGWNSSYNQIRVAKRMAQVSPVSAIMGDADYTSISNWNGEPILIYAVSSILKVGLYSTAAGYAPYQPSWRHQGGTNYLFSDGSAKTVKYGSVFNNDWQLK